MQLKRILSMLLAAALIFSTSMVTVNAETVETIETFEVGVVAETTTPVSFSPAIYKSGDEVSVKISADQNTGITILKFSVKFDPDALEFVDYTSANLFSNDIEGVYVYSDSICYTLMMNNVSTATGEMLTLNFKVKEAFCGDIAIYAEVFDGQDKNCINGLKVVPFVGGRASFAAHAVDADAGVVTEPTCTEEGYTTYHCDICNENIKGNTLASLGHTSSDPVEENRIEPTCTEDGAYDSVVYCSVCNEELSREAITIAATGHTADNAVEENRIAPTCTENGTYDSVVYCLVCNDELSHETITIDATGHDAANAVEENRVNPTCTEDGFYDSVVYCSVCNEELSRETITLNKLGHDIITHEAQSPTCTQVGWDAYDTCSRCDYTTYKEIHPLGHNPTVTKEENRVEATCISDGSYDSVVYCSVCDEELSRETITLNKLGHDLIHHDAKDATCTEIGWEAYDTCSRCDYTTYKEIHSLGHNPTVTKEENRVEATCISDGSYDSVVYCSVCDEELSRETITLNKLGHDLIHHDAKDATCTEIGWEAYDTCSRCDYTTYVEISALGHKFDGDCDKECNNCDNTREAPDHVYDDVLDAVCNVCNYIREITFTGWYSDGADWYYYENGDMVKNDWRQDSVGWVYLGSSGAMLTNAWCTDSQGWCYVGADGYAVTNCWKQDSIGWCYLGANGSQVKNNWVLDGGKWYFINADGYMVSNCWKQDSKGWVYLGSSGAMLTNAWCTDSQGWCYVGADGYAVTNCWKQDSIGWIWLNSNGSMTKSAWIQDGGNWYYLNADGYMVTGAHYIDGVWYNFTSNGVWIA